MFKLKSKPELPGVLQRKLEPEELETLFREVVNQISTVYQHGTDEWLKKNRRELDQAVQDAEKELDRVWDEAANNKATVEDFKKALETFYQATVQGMTAYKAR